MPGTIDLTISIYPLCSSAKGICLMRYGRRASTQLSSACMSTLVGIYESQAVPGDLSYILIGAYVLLALLQLFSTPFLGFDLLPEARLPS